MKAQIQTQIFVYIIAIVIVGLILVFGYKSVKDFGEKSEQVALLSFKTDIESTFKSISSSFGQVKVKTIRLPAGYVELCFINLKYKPKTNYFTEQDFEFNPLLYVGVEEKKNVFLVKGIDFEGYDVGDITVDGDGNECLSSVGGCDPFEDVVFEGNGKEDNNEKHFAPNAQAYALCLKQKQGAVKLKLVGKGDHVFVSEKKDN